MNAEAGDRVRSTRVAPLRVRPMETRDIPRVVAIADSLPHAPHWPISVYQAALNPRSEPRRVALVAEALEPDAPDLEILEFEAVQPAAQHPGSVTGFVVASLIAGEAELESIAVAVEVQRCGAGSKLLVRLQHALSAAGVIRVNLEVRASNGLALALYKRHGFSETGRRVGYYADPVEDAVLMGLDLG